MLNIKDISNRIENTQLITSDDLDILKEYSDNTPYCQLYSILYLKGLSLNEDIRFDQEIGAHSYRITDRVQLYNLIQDKVQAVELSINEDNKSVDQPVELEQVIQVAELATPEENEIVESDEINIDLTPISNEVISNESEIAKEEKTLDNVEKSILEHAFTANYSLPELNEEEKIAVEQKNNSPIKTAELNQDIKDKKEEIEINIDTKQSFNSWLNSNRNYTTTSNTDKDEILSIAQGKEELKDSNELFGKVEKPKKEFFSPTQKGKESLQEDSLPVSETLAKIYALQGNFPKAISAYNQLSLKYPEKKIFFAVQIKELQKKLNK